MAVQVEAAQAAAAAALAAAATRRAAQATELAQLREHLRQAESFLAQKARQVQAQVPAHLFHKVCSFVPSHECAVGGWVEVGSALAEHLSWLLFDPARAVSCISCRDVHLRSE